MFSRRFLSPLLLLLLAAWAASPARADTVTIGALKDNSIFGPATPNNSDGLGPGLYAGTAGARVDDNIRRALIDFDVAAAVPAGSIITSVTFKLTLGKSPTSPVGPNIASVSLHKLALDWGEGASNSTLSGGGAGIAAQPGDATWLANFFQASNWHTAGGDFAASASASRNVGRYDPTTPTTISWGGSGAIADVQGWLNNPATNFGWILIGDEVNDYSARRFVSSDDPAGLGLPSLTIIYTPAPEPTAAALLASAAAFLGTSRRVRKPQRQRTNNW